MANGNQITLTLKKTTKGTLVYANDEAGFQGIYFSKELPLFQGLPEPPTTITMTLAVGK